MMTQAQYDRLVRQGYTHIPLVHEVSADLDTPVGVYLKLANRPYSYLLESVSGGEHWGRYSIIGAGCTHHIRVNGNTVGVYRADGCAEQERVVDNPLKWISDYATTFRTPEPDTLPRFTGGLVGYFGYETIGCIEPRLSALGKPDELGTPDILLLVSEKIAVFDNLHGSLSLIVYANAARRDGYKQARDELAEMEQQLREPPPMPTANPGAHQSAPAEDDFVSGFGRDAFMQAVEKCRSYIIAGDAMQIVLSHRLHAPFTAPPVDFYRALRRLNPSPYMFCLNFGDFHVVGSSPEILVRLEGGELTVRPIAGTRRRGGNSDEDLRMERELLSDEKELAEHLMLIDLGRNDLGRICEAGSVRVTEKMVVERYSHVMHIVSNVVGHRRNGIGPIETLCATFPAGTVSGAPKIRAMEIIAELEPVKRNVYSGAVGYVGWNGAMDTAIAIRTAVIRNDTLFVQAGAGLVYDSIPEREWMETMNKARVMFSAAAMTGDKPGPTSAENAGPPCS